MEMSCLDRFSCSVITSSTYRSIPTSNGLFEPDEIMGFLATRTFDTLDFYLWSMTVLGPFSDTYIISTGI